MKSDMIAQNAQIVMILSTHEIIRLVSVILVIVALAFLILGSRSNDDDNDDDDDYWKNWGNREKATYT